MKTPKLPTILTVPYDKRHLAERHGAIWCASIERWVHPGPTLPRGLKRFSEAIDPEEARALLLRTEHVAIIPAIFPDLSLQERNQVFTNAAKDGNLELVAWLLAQRVIPTGAALIAAACGNHDQVVEVLTRTGIWSPDVTTLALLKAAECGAVTALDSPVAQLLVRAGARSESIRRHLPNFSSHSPALAHAA